MTDPHTPQGDLLDRQAAAARAETNRAIDAVPPTFDRLRVRQARRRSTALVGTGAVAVIAVVALAIGLTDDRRDDVAHEVITGPPTSTGVDSPDPGTNPVGLLDPGEAGVMAPSLLAPRRATASVWIGEQFFLWGGSDSHSNRFDDGALYEPATDRWEMLPPAPIGPRTGASAVWTGDEVLVVGGSAIDGENLVPLGDAAAYNPATKVWRLLEPAPEDVWDGSVVADGVLYAASTEQRLLAYDIEADQWSEVESPRTVLLVVGLVGVDRLVVRHSASQLMALDLSTGEWTDLPALDEPHHPYLVVGDHVMAVDAMSAATIKLLEPDATEWHTYGGVPAEPELGSEIGVEDSHSSVLMTTPWVTAVGDSVVFFNGGDVAWVFDVGSRQWSPTDAGGLDLRGSTPGAFVGGGDLVLAWSGELSRTSTNPAGANQLASADDGVVFRLPDAWPDGVPYSEFATPRSRARTAGVELEIGSILDSWDIERTDFTSWREAYSDERAMFLAPSVGAVVAGLGPAAVAHLIEGEHRVEYMTDVDRHQIAGFEAVVSTNPSAPHETVVLARGEGRTVRWISVGLEHEEVLAAVTELLEGAAEDWEEPGYDFASLSVQAEVDGRTGENRVLIPRWTVTAPDGSTYRVRRLALPDSYHLAQAAVIEMVAGSNIQRSPLDGGPPIWVRGHLHVDSGGNPSVAWFADDLGWVVEGISPDDPHLPALLEGLVG